MANSEAVRSPTPFPCLACLVVFIVATLVCSVYFRGLLWQPGQFVPAQTGDGLTIHYNLAYHAKYGSGSALTSQYHPYAESVFMTDAHALLAVAFAKLEKIVPGAAAYAVPVAGAVVFWSLPLSVVALFYLLVSLEVGVLLAMVFSVLIGLMTPQIHRQLSGQYTLGITWLLPLLCWYLVAAGRDRYLWWSVLVAGVLYLLGLNNPYLYAIGASFLLAAAGVGGVLRLAGQRWLSWQTLFSWLGVVSVATVATLVTLRAADHVTDRVAVPYGFFDNVADWGGLLLSPDVLLYDQMQEWTALGPTLHENPNYLGWAPLLALLLAGGLMLRSRHSLGLHARRLVYVLLPAGVLGAVFSFGVPFRWFPDWTYDHLGPVLQFRAPARFAWPLYYTLGLSAAVLLGTWWRKTTHRTVATAVVSGIVLLWSVEVHQFLTQKLAGKYYANPLAEAQLVDYRALVAQHGIDTASFSSIFLLPTELGWTDKIHHGGTFRSNHDGYQLSYVTGLPLLNGKLSRVSLSRSLESQQLTSDPLVGKPLLERLDPGKDILLLATGDDMLDPEERRVRYLGQTIATYGEVTLLRLSPADWLAAHDRAVVAARADTALTEQYVRFDWDADAGPAFAGAGARRLPAGWSELVTLGRDSLPDDGPWRMSGWVYVDGRRFGGPHFELQQLDANGNVTGRQKQWINRVYETQRGWQRFDFLITPKSDTRRLLLTAGHDFPYRLDELWVRPADRSARVTTAEGTLYNGFWLPQ